MILMREAAIVEAWCHGWRAYLEGKPRPSARLIRMFPTIELQCYVAGWDEALSEDDWHGHKSS